MMGTLASIDYGNVDRINLLHEPTGQEIDLTDVSALVRTVTQTGGSSGRELRITKARLEQDITISEQNDLLDYNLIIVKSDGTILPEEKVAIQPDAIDVRSGYYVIWWRQ